MDIFRYIILLSPGFLLPSGVLGYQDGAPKEACEFLNPGHGVAGQFTVSPYVITPSQETYQCRETIRVNITSRDDTQLRGFLCQARTDVGRYDTVVGRLEADPADSDNIKYVCGTGRGLTHTINTDKSSVSFTWAAEEPHGSITFICTLVKSKLKFWDRQTSVTLRYKEGGDCSKSACTGLQLNTGSLLSLVPVLRLLMKIA